MGILRHLRKIEVVSFTLEMYGIPKNGERVQISNLKNKHSSNWKWAKIIIQLSLHFSKGSFNIFLKDPQKLHKTPSKYTEYILQYEIDSL